MVYDVIDIGELFRSNLIICIYSWCDLFFLLNRFKCRILMVSKICFSGDIITTSEKLNNYRLILYLMATTPAELHTHTQ